MTGLRILIVEDEAIIAANLALTVDSLGYSVIGPVATGEDAIKKVIEFHPDLVLMDIELVGGMNGIDVAEKIRSFAQIPIIYLTAYTDEKRLKQALKTDPYGYLVKPVHSRELYAMIEMSLNKSRSDRKVQDSEEQCRAVVTGAQEGIVIFESETKKILEANPAFKEQFGYSEDDIASLTLYDLIAEGSDAIDRDVRSVIARTYIPGKKFLRSKDGSEILIEVSAGVIERNNGDAVVYIITPHIEDKNQSDEVLREANQKIRLLIGLTRHDVLNHLSVIQGLHYLLMTESDPVIFQENLTLANKICGQIEATIRFTREYENFGLVPFNWHLISPVIESAKKEFSSDIVRTENQIPGDLEIYSDPLIRKVITTLIDNAIRHGKKVTTIRFSSYEKDGTLMIICEDDGNGIPEKDKEQIFDHGFGKHTGIGLFLAREILSITGLTIRETGTEGKGARFEMTVPEGKYRRAAL